jgi:hypothetical protein
MIKNESAKCTWSLIQSTRDSYVSLLKDIGLVTFERLESVLCISRDYTESNSMTCIQLTSSSTIIAVRGQPLTIQPIKLDNIRSLIHQRIHSPGTDPAMTQPHDDQGSVDENFLHDIPEELIEHPNNCFNCLSRFVAATEPIM